MPEHRDLQEMIEVLSISIVREEAEESFYRRSASASTSQVGRRLFTEIADDVAKHRQNLEQRRNGLVDVLRDLEKATGEGPTTEGEQGISGGKRDPVCKMEIKDECRFTSTYQGREYRFCSEDCKVAFDLDPDKYLRE